MADKYLGIDYGKAKVGLAIADSETRMAFAYGTLTNDKDFLYKLGEIVEREGVEKVIIGMHSCRGFSSTAVEEKPLLRLANFFKDKLNIEVEYQNEMYSTQQAERNLIEKGVKKIKKYDDQEAARIILQSWLDKKK